MVKEVRQKASGDLAVDLDLLQGRIYSQWKGHDSDAITIYDRLAEVLPFKLQCVLLLYSLGHVCRICTSAGLLHEHPQFAAPAINCLCCPKRSVCTCADLA